MLSLLLLGLYWNVRRTSRPMPPQLALPQEPPDLVLLITANRQGKLEVCGCPGKRAEDLAKVASLILATKHQLERRGSVVGILEGGDFTGGADVVPPLLKAYQLIGYQGIALSPRDEKRLSVIRTNANGIPLLLPPRDGNFATFRLNGKALNLVVANLGRPPLEDEQYWQRASIYLQGLRQPNTVVAALVYVDRNEVMEIAPRLKGATDILLLDDQLPSASPNAELSPSPAKVSEKIGGVTVIALPQSRAAILSLNLWQGQSDREPFRVEGQWLYASGHPDHDQVKQIVNAYYEKRQKELEREMQELLKIAEKREYLPPEFCGSCHQAQYEQWLSTGHAHAIDTLVKQKRMDKSCLPCHSLEFRMRGVVTVKKNRGVECVDCHVELQDPATARMHGQRPGERPSTKIVNEVTCLRCHDKQNSPNFDLRTYLPKVTH